MKSLISSALIVASLLIPISVEAAQNEKNQVTCNDRLGEPLARYVVTTLPDREISRIGDRNKCGADKSIDNLTVKIKRINEQSVQLTKNVLRAYLDGRIKRVSFDLDSIDEDWVTGIRMADLFWNFRVKGVVDRRSDCSGACSLLYVASSDREPFGTVALTYPSERDAGLMYDGRTVADHIERIYRTSFAEKALRLSKKNAGSEVSMGAIELLELDLIENGGDTERGYERIKQGCGKPYFERFEQAKSLREKTCKPPIDDFLKCMHDIERVSGTGPAETAQCVAPFSYPAIDG